MSACAYVAAQINSPELLAFKRIGIYEDIACIAGLGIVFGIGWVPLKDYLVITVAI